VAVPGSAWHFAAARIGAVSSPLIPIYRDREVGFMVGLAEVKVLVVPREFRNVRLPGDGGPAAPVLAVRSSCVRR
jgi:acyl-coenzyme A synthetase/AMP-(fatty) acid ligase